MTDALLQSDIPGYSCRRGKVRDVYDLGEMLIIVATDRISAFDWILPTPIPGKGRTLTAMTLFWFDLLQVRNHFISANLADMPEAFRRDELVGRTMLVRKAKVIAFECVARGYLAGSGWKEYRTTGTVAGIRLPTGLVDSSRLETPIFTPAIKAESGHDENISFEQLSQAIGAGEAQELKSRTLKLYAQAADYAASRGLLLADTKFEFGRLPTDEIIIVDEILTPDSSRFWPADAYVPGRPQPSFDKQFVRDWLETSGWDKNSPPPALPSEVVTGTAARYEEAFSRLLVGRA